MLTKAYLSGCKDFLKDPWTFEELFYKVSLYVKKRRFKFADISVQVDPSELRRGDLSTKISTQEYAIITILLQSRGDSVTRETLYYAIWGKKQGESRVVDMHIARLREKLSILTGFPGATIIVTMRGSGYCIPDRFTVNPHCAYPVDNAGKSDLNR